MLPCRGFYCEYYRKTLASTEWAIKNRPPTSYMSANYVFQEYCTARLNIINSD